MVKVIPLLADPAAHGGDPADSFDVVVPSLPGYGFSDRPTMRGCTTAYVAAMVARLMTDVRWCSNTWGVQRPKCGGAGMSGGVRHHRPRSEDPTPRPPRARDRRGAQARAQAGKLRVVRHRTRVTREGRRDHPPGERLGAPAVVGGGRVAPNGLRR